MNVYITSSGPTLDSEIDPRFGRCPWFLFVKTDDGTFEPVENHFVEQASGAGVEAARLVADCNPAAVLTGQCGPQAQRVLETAGIKVIAGCVGAAKEVVKRIRQVGLAKVGLPPRGIHHHAGKKALPDFERAGILQGSAVAGRGELQRTPFDEDHHSGA